MAIVKQSMCVLCALGFLSANSGLVASRGAGYEGNGASKEKAAIQTTAPQKTTNGAGAGKIKLNDFTIKKTSDAASPALQKTNGAGAGRIKSNDFTIKKTTDK